MNKYEELSEKGYPLYCVSCKKKVRGYSIQIRTLLQRKSGLERYILYAKCPLCKKKISNFISKKLYYELCDNFYRR